MTMTMTTQSSPKPSAAMCTNAATALSDPLFGSLFGSSIELQPPAVVYQTKLTDDGTGSMAQDSSTPLKLIIRLSDPARLAFSKLRKEGKEIDTLVHGAIRRVDLAELESYDATSGRMLGLRLSQKSFSYDFRPASGELCVFVHRKELPVSTSFGDAPMVFVFFLSPVSEMVVTSAFTIASKERAGKCERPVPKRIRGPPPRRPFAAPAHGVEAEINARLQGPASPAGSVPTLTDDLLPLTSDDELPDFFDEDEEELLASLNASV